MAAKTADLYLRLSDARNENGSFAERERKLRMLAGARGWTVRRVVTENDLGPDGKPKPASAFKRRKVRVPGSDLPQLRVIRPGFRSIVEDLAAGRVDALIAEDLDRVARDPRDLEDLVDAVRATRANAAALSGSLSFTDGGTDAEVLQARVLVAVAAKSSADTARRVSASRERRAREGKWGGGKRPYGFCLGAPAVPDDGKAEDHPCPWHGARTCQAGITTIDEEVTVVRESAHALVGGGSLRGLARDLREREVPTVTGRPWSAETLKDILLRPRNAGLMEWRGETFPAPWEPLVEPAVHERVVAILTDPERRTGPGRAPRWLGSGIYRCPTCPGGGRVSVLVGNRRPNYRCQDCTSWSRRAEPVDELVAAFVIEYLAAKGTDLLVPQREEVDVAALSTERKAIEANMREFAAAAAIPANGLSVSDVIANKRAGTARIAEIDAQLSDAVVDDELAPWVNAVDPEAMWNEATLEERRRLVRRLLVVRILPQAGRTFRPESIDIRPARTLPS